MSTTETLTPRRRPSTPPAPRETRPHQGWFVRGLVRWCRRLLRLVIVLAVAAALEWAGAPALVSVPFAVLVGVLSFRWGLLRVDDPPRRNTQAAFVVSMLFLAATAWSFTGAMTAAGAAPFDVRTGDWMRDHHLNPVVDVLEQRIYGQGAPGNGPVAQEDIPERIANVTSAPSVLSPTPTAPTATASPTTPQTGGPLIDNSLPSEGQWVPSHRKINSAPATYTTFVRPDADHSSAVAAAVYLDPTATRLVYVPGTDEPTGSGWAWNSGIPRFERDGLIAAFNSGWKFKDTKGGAFTEGKTPVPLVDGQASLVIYRDGHSDIGAWGTDVSMTPDVVSVRQNLELVVDQGKPVDGLKTSIDGQWGKRKYQIQYTRRSGIGITDTGALVYVAGDDLTTDTMATALSQVGAVRGMELDIHSKHPTFNFFEPSASAGSGVTASKLYPSMPRPATRYLSPDQRDFFAVVAR
ncbi:MAG: phosphodiester glycosidase family protein [Acidimicrobiales bacterium]|nr:phosphodiester glycosidase family protein [Acidimicrobiales bacterium]